VRDRTWVRYDVGCAGLTWKAAMIQKGWAL